MLWCCLVGSGQAGFRSGVVVAVDLVAGEGSLDKQQHWQSSLSQVVANGWWSFWVDVSCGGCLLLRRRC